MKKTLIFEGAGWADADTSRETDVSNCRIRTRIRNNDGRLIYLEMSGTKHEGKHIPEWAKGNNVTSYIQHVFYEDHSWDKKRNFSKTLSNLTRMHFEYNKESILTFVNENLNCSFIDMEVINEGLCVFDNENPLCDCSKPGYKPFKEPQVNIDTLTGIKPLYAYKDGYRAAEYKINYEYFKELPYIKEYIAGRTDRERSEYPNHTFYSCIRWDQDGIINSIEVSSRSNFASISLGAEELEVITDAIIKSNEWKEIAV